MTAFEDAYQSIREEVGKLCAHFPAAYWLKLDQTRSYPTEFVKALTEAGYLSILIPQEFGGAGLGISAAAAVLETIHAEGCNGAASHAQLYTMGTILRHGSFEQKKEISPPKCERRVATTSVRRNGAYQRHRHRIIAHCCAP